MSKHIFSKIAKIGEEVRSAQPMKVELALTDNLAAYAKGVSKYKSEGDGLIKRAERLMSELKETKSALYKWAEVGNSIADDVASDLVKFEKASKELGIDPNSNADFKAANAAFQEYAKLSKEYIAIAKK
jgi:hypothetical protein